jgi:Zn-dependent protease
MFLLSIVGFLIALTVHEAAHALVADRLGDPTARSMGRVSLNPIRHIDPIGTILLPLTLLLAGSPVLFGWAKPVMFDPFNLQNPRKDAALISLSGPIANFLTAVIASVLLHVLPPFPFMSLFLISLIQVNVVLALFNLIPVSPLDGFAVVTGLLSESAYRSWESLARYGPFILLFLILPLTPNGSILWMILNPPLDMILSVLIP